MILHLRSKFRFNRPIWRRDVAKKRFSIWRPPAILNLQNFDIFDKCSFWELKYVSSYQILSESDNSRLRYWDKAVFKMAAVRILNLRKLLFWSCDLYLHVILHLRSKFRINWPIRRRDLAKNNDFQYGVCPPSWICRISILWQKSILGMEICICIPNLIEIG